MNLDDGSALTAFSIRSQQSKSAPLHAYASLRPRGGNVQIFGPHEVRFSTTRRMDVAAHARHLAGCAAKCGSEIERSLRNRSWSTRNSTRARALARSTGRARAGSFKMASLLGAVISR